jgi:hypothetical protein
MTKLCARGKAAAKRKFSVYPSAYANAYASKICAGKIKDPSGTKRKDWGPKGKKIGGEAKTKINEVIGGLKKASKTHAAQAKTLETLKANEGMSIEVLREESQKIINDFPKEKKYNYKKPKKKPYMIKEPSDSMKIDTTTSQYGDSGKGRKAIFTELVCGGEVRGTGAAIKGKGFKGIF